MSHNENFDNLVKSLTKKVESVASPNQWSDIFNELKSFSGPLNYNFTLNYLTMGLAIIGIVCEFLYTDNNSLSLGEFNGLDINTIGYGMFGVLFVIPLISVMKGSSKISQLSDSIFNKDICFDNNLRKIATQRKLPQYSHNFYDFDRGDEDQEIEEVFQGQFVKDGFKLPYDLYKFSYVEVTYQTITVGKTTTTQRVETTYYRYGFVCPFPYLKSNIILAEDPLDYNLKHEWETSSTEFNKRFTVYADSEMEVAKFLSPSTIIALTDGLNLVDMNLEFIDGLLCISCSDDDIYTLKRKFGIEDPHAFELEIKRNLTLTKLKALENLVYKLVTNSDKNFK